MQSRPATLSEQSGSARPASCPSDDQLLAFVPGKLAGPDADSIAEHLATCAVCQTRVSTLRQRLSDRKAEEKAPPAARAAGRESDSPTTLVVREIRPRAPQRLGEYELLRAIGRGGMGLVYLGRHVRLQRHVAVKVLPRLELADESAIVRMQRESAAAGRVRHPNIVYATDAGECEGVHYLVMEYVAGVDLSKLVAALGPLPAPEACEIIRQAALGLNHIAQCGLVHRDLKPSNVMLDDEGTVKILDLGLARVHHNTLEDSEPTQAGYLLGTADYIAPEQIDSPHDADVRSDLYSLGCTFHKLLAGSAPFSGPDQNSVSRKVEAHRHAPPPAIRTLRPDVPEAVEQVLLSLLAKRPDDRCQSPQELAELLAPHAEGADLAALVKRVREQVQPDDWPLDPLQTPVAPTATTQSMGRSETPQPAGRRRALSSGPRLAIAAGILLAAIGVLIAVWSGGNGSGSAPPPPFKKAIKYDVSAGLREIQWIGYQRSPPGFYSHERRMLELRPDSYQLLELGQYDGTPGTFSVTIGQAAWRGDCGLFFGCRPEPKLNRSELTTFQLFVLEYHPAQGQGAGSVKELFRLTRQRAILGINPTQLHDDAGTMRTQPFAAPRGSQLHLEITFGKTGCEQVRVSGEPLGDLAAGDLNGQYLPEDYRGSFGLYCAGAGAGQRGQTWFGNLEFTPSE